MKKNKLFTLSFIISLVLGLITMLNAESGCQSNELTNLRKRIDKLENELKQIAKDSIEKCNDPTISITDMPLPKLMIALGRRSSCVSDYVANAAQKQVDSGQVRAIGDDLNIYFSNAENEACKKERKELLMRLSSIYKSVLGENVVQQAEEVRESMIKKFKSL